MPGVQWPISTFHAHVGQEIGVSSWIDVDQARIDDFARVTLDEQYIHVDPIRAQSSPFGGTIAHGFLSLSLLSAMGFEALPSIEGAATSINYGFCQIRFLAPVPSGRRVRARFTLKSIDEKRADNWLMTLAVMIEVENQSKPAVVAEWMILTIC